MSSAKLISATVILFAMTPSLAVAQGGLAPQAQRAPQAFSQGGQVSGERRAPRPPPAEAFNACEGRQAGDEVGILAPDGELVAGTCVQRGPDIFARPDRPVGPDHRSVR